MKMNEDQIIMTEKDLLRIQHLIGVQSSEEFEDLELELERAKIIADNEVSSDLVTMNSRVRFILFPEEKEQVVTLVYPGDANLKEGKISIFAPLGAALIGLRVGQTINWQFPGKKTKTIKVEELLYQPEAHEDWHL